MVKSNRNNIKVNHNQKRKVNIFGFLLGRNIELSYNEAICKLSSSRIPSFLPRIVGNLLIIRTSYSAADVLSAVSNLAGTLRIFELFESQNFYEITELLFADEEISNRKIGISQINLDNYEESEFTDYLKAFESKSIKFIFSKKQNHQAVLDSRIAQKLKLGEEGMVVKLKENIFLLGRCIHKFDLKIFKQEDESRAKRLFSHGTSPKLARIMINLAGLKQNQIILDPFCGTGTIIIQAFKLGFRSIGIELNNEVFEVAKSNITEITKSNTDINIINADSTEFMINENIDAVVFEPYMGPFLKKIPTSLEAQKIIAELDALYSKLFLNLSKIANQNLKVVCILPGIPDNRDTIHWSNESSFSKCGFKIQKNIEIYIDQNNVNISIYNPVLYESAGQNIIKRRIYILEKKKSFKRF